MQMFFAAHSTTFWSKFEILAGGQDNFSQLDLCYEILEGFFWWRMSWHSQKILENVLISSKEMKLLVFMRLIQNFRTKI